MTDPTPRTAHDQQPTHLVATTMNPDNPVPMTAGEVHDHTVWGSVLDAAELTAEAVGELFSGDTAGAQQDAQAAKQELGQAVEQVEQEVKQAVKGGGSGGSNSGNK